MDYLDVSINLPEIILVLVKHGVRLHQSPHNQRLAHPMRPKLLKSPSRLPHATSTSESCPVCESTGHDYLKPPLKSKLSMLRTAATGGMHQEENGKYP